MATNDLPEEARRFAQLPSAPNTELSRRYHLRVYERWCEKHSITAWPATLPMLLEFAADRGSTHSYSTVRSHIRIVAIEERARSGNELYTQFEMQQVLKGVMRERPTQPVRPLTAIDLSRVFDFVPARTSQRRTRATLLLTYAGGINLMEHLALQIEMITFVDQGLVIRGLSPHRPQIFVGHAQDAQRCPVRAVQVEVGDRAIGPLWISPRSRRPDGGMVYGGLKTCVELYGKACGVRRLSNERVLQSGLVEMSIRVSPFRLAHFLGRRSVTDFTRKMRCRNYSPF